MTLHDTSAGQRADPDFLMASGISMERLQRDYDAVRSELTEIGLSDGTEAYLGSIDCSFSLLPPIFGEMGFIFDPSVPLFAGLVGYEEGVIYVPKYWNPHEGPRTDNSIRNIIRHEFGHAWAWLDPAFFGKPWFRSAFGGSYWANWNWENDEYNDEDFITQYAQTNPAEDFCETFMMFLKYRRSLSRFKRRPGAYAKLLSVKDAVTLKSKELPWD